MDYKFRELEPKWRNYWKDNKVYAVSNNSTKPKYYVLDMFPYPSGAGLHVGHPLGYIASDIYARYKRLKGFNVLHPMGFDSFGLPAEQYALETGQHPAVTTQKNIATFKNQLDKIGFCYDWEREIKTCNPDYYKWTQKIFLELFNSYYCNFQKKAKPIAALIEIYETKGSAHFTAAEWNNFSTAEKEEWLMKSRLAYSSYGEVNWCEALGTVLANDEVVNGVSERGGHPVIKKKMRQWYLRITAYADRLLEGLEKVDFSESMKEMQRNWIGKSEGAEVEFTLLTSPQPLSKGEGQSTTPNYQNSTPGYVTTTIEQWKVLSDFAKQNRKNATAAEDALWQEIRNRKIKNFKFRRQHPIAGFIPDFVCLEQKLIVEIDVEYHNTEEQKIYDEAREQWLKEHSYKLIRFTNEEILTNMPNVLQQLDKALSFGEGRVRVYTTRPDTIFGVDFMVIAPEHEIIESITTTEQKQKVEKYITYVKSRSDRERQAEKNITGVFTGAYAVNPFNGKQIPIWISEYVLAGYGTGAIMAVPCGDERDFKFAQHFNIPITNIIGEHFNGKNANPTKEAVLENSGFLTGLPMKEAIDVAINKIEELEIGIRKVNYKMRDAGFSRQRYWGEPFPIIWKDGIATPLDKNELPLELPHVEKYSPAPGGEGPLANITAWINTPEGKRESSTMPGYAGSSWYFLRYADPKNDKEFASRQATDYWNSVDLYIGGTEHAVGHLLYSRMWTKVLYDLGFISFDEPFKKLLNQGMIQGSSRFVYRINGTNTFISKGLIEGEEQYFYQGKKLDKIHVDVNIVDGFELDIEAFKLCRNKEFANAEFILEDGKYICGAEVEKMSKSKYNTVNPDDLCEQYGADTFRMYEMFLGPIEQSKPWDTKGIEGVHRFLKKLWRLFYSEGTYNNGQAIDGKPIWTNDTPTPEELKVLHKTIKKIDDDTERFSYNTAVSAFMVCINELHDLKCNKKEILEQILILLTPYAPHIAEELWHVLGNTTTILDAVYPMYNPSLTIENNKEYPISINGKMRTTINFPLDAEQKDIDPVVLENEIVKKWLEGKQPKKIIFVKNKMINVVV
ncbi:MAG: leucine--tRNA ligase [Chitinophagaceae bacterium]|nr:leucine--tRNA ligase [Chitinophagaceae bacterium]